MLGTPELQAWPLVLPCSGAHLSEQLYTGPLHPFNSDLSLQRGGHPIVETVALSTRVLVLDLSQRCSIMLRQSFLKIRGL